MVDKTLIFAGLIKEHPDCGISMKNSHLIEKFQEYYKDVKVICLKRKGIKRLAFSFNILRVVILSFFYTNAKIIISATAWEAYPLIKSLLILGKANRVFYWVPGGVFHIVLERGKYEAEIFAKIRKIFVQSPSMVVELEKLGIRNAVYVPNSKKISYYPQIKHSHTDVTKFVFLSRIHPAKGCSLIIQSVMMLNKVGYGSRFLVDFYGNIDSKYRSEFIRNCKKITNVNYKGYLDTREESGYDILSSYDAMLFPTFWWGEGMPGVIIDAFICGLPVLASDWNFNCDVVDCNTGVIILPNNEKELYMGMKNILDMKYDLSAISQNCRKKARIFDIDNVLSESNLRKWELL